MIHRYKLAFYSGFALLMFVAQLPHSARTTAAPVLVAPLAHSFPQTLFDEPVYHMQSALISLVEETECASGSCTNFGATWSDQRADEVPKNCNVPDCEQFGCHSYQRFSCRNGKIKDGDACQGCPCSCNASGIPPPSNPCPKFCDYSRIGGGGGCAGGVDLCTYPTWGCPDGLWAIGDCCCLDFFLLIDEGDGFALTDVISGVEFDVTGDGKLGFISWTLWNSDDAWLVLDVNENGTIDNGTELFGNTMYEDSPRGQHEEQVGVGNSRRRAKHGFEALAKHDVNRDERITPADPIYAKLRLWQDRNHNGVSEPGELIPLTQKNIAGIEVKYKEVRQKDRHGNEFRYQARILDSLNPPRGNRIISDVGLTSRHKR